MEQTNNKQSSVEWFAVMIVKMGYVSTEILEQAKAMHRVEIIESYASGSNDRLRNTINTNYYNETFGGNNEQ